MTDHQNPQENRGGPANGPDEGELVELVDIEMFAKENRVPPRARQYRFRIDRDHFTVDHRIIEGKELFRLANKSPSQWRMHQKLRGGQMKEITIDDKVDLGQPGIERFVTMELTQGDGEQTPSVETKSPASEESRRRQFRLPEEDEAYINLLGLRWETITDGSVRWLLLHEHPMPAGYHQSTATAAIRIEGGYPPAKLDMVYFLPHLTRVNGKAIHALDVQLIDGAAYQRWSRHYEWREDVDSLGTHHLRIKNWLDAELQR